jgi:dihydroflavonol-4-reductase
VHALVTGANGHLGANLVRAALAEGWKVRALVRTTSNLQALSGLDIETVTGDILDPASLDAACEGVELVLHAAAVYRNWAADDDAIVGPAVRGTENVLRAAARAGVGRLVLTSSIAAVGYGRPGESLDESHFMQNPQSAYVRAKCESEALALALGPELGVEVVVCNPGGNMGPWDINITPTTRAVRSLCTGGPALLDLGPTHIEDIAKGHLLAAERGVAGERYLLTGENLTKEQLAALFTELTGVTVKTLALPRFVLWVVAVTEVLKARFTGKDADITPRQVSDVFGKVLWYDSAKAQEQLGWTHRPARETVLDTLAWLAVRGELPKAVAAKVLEQRPADPDWPEA